MLQIFTLFLVVFISFAAQAKPTQDLECRELVSRLAPVESYRGDKVPTTAQRDLAIRSLKEIPQEANTSISEIRSAVQSDMAAAFFKYYYRIQNCHKTKLNLLRMLMKHAVDPKTSKDSKSTDLAAIRLELGRKTFPLLKEVGMKIDALSEAVESKLFAAPTLNEEIAKLKGERDREVNDLDSLQNHLLVEPMVHDGEENVTLASIRKTYANPKNKKQVENLREYSLAELKSVEHLEADFKRALDLIK